MAVGDKLPVVMGKEKAAPNGVATLGEDGKLAEAQRPTYTAADVGAVQDPETAGTAGQILVLDQEGKPVWRDPPDTGVTTFNGRTGEVVPQAGDYNATQIPVSADAGAQTVVEALASKAPAGFGLGGQSKALTSDDDLNTIRENGWYRWGSSSPQNAPKMASEAGGAGYIFARVTNYDAQNVLQEYWSLHQDAQNKARRICRNGVWGPLEWINPPMELGVEYRTAEKYNKTPVYCDLVNCGALPPNGTTKSVQHGISSIDCVLRAYGTSPNGKFTIPYQANSEGIGVCANANTIYIESQNLEFDPTTYTVQVVIFYTKVE